MLIIVKTTKLKLHMYLYNNENLELQTCRFDKHFSEIEHDHFACQNVVNERRLTERT